MNKNQSIGMYVILGIMVLAFISMLFSGPTSSTEELSYTAFLQKVENKEIYIKSPRDNVKKIFSITGLDKIFKMEG